MSLIGVSVVQEEAMLLMVLPYLCHGDVKSFLKSKRGSQIEVTKFPEVILFKCSYDTVIVH